MMMMSNSHLLECLKGCVPCLAPPSLVLFIFLSSCTTHYSLHCDIASHFLLEIQEISVQYARLPQTFFLCVNSGYPQIKTHVFLFHLCRWIRGNLKNELSVHMQTGDPSNCLSRPTLLALFQIFASSSVFAFTMLQPF